MARHPKLALHGVDRLPPAPVPRGPVPALGRGLTFHKAHGFEELPLDLVEQSQKFGLRLEELSDVGVVGGQAGHVLVASDQLLGHLFAPLGPFQDLLLDLLDIFEHDAGRLSGRHHLAGLPHPGDRLG